MPKWGKSALSKILIVKYPNLKDHCTKKGKLDLRKIKVILDIIKDEADKEEFISIFKIKGKQNDTEGAEVEKEKGVVKEKVKK